MDSATIAKMRADHDKRREFENQARCVSQLQEAQQAACGAPMGYEAQRPRSAAEQTVYDLSERAYRSTVEGEKAKLALDIIQEHPEFLEFIELIRTGMVSIY